MLAFMLFAFVASITPGPTNFLVLSNSASHGLRAALPIILGAGAGAALIVWLVGSGMGEVLFRAPAVQPLLNGLGVAWLTWLAWKIFRSPVQVQQSGATSARPGLWGAAALQVINPKTWMMALAVASVFIDAAASDRLLQVTHLSLVFFVIALPCLGGWALLGSGARRLSGSPVVLRRVNQGLALLLLVSAWASLWQ